MSGLKRYILFPPLALQMQYEADKMTCQFRGPWHLGISAEACQNANGIWTRGPCLILQECINDAIVHGSDSPSFMKFINPLVIKDPRDQSQCENARTGLGHDNDDIDDVEVCDHLEDMLCENSFGAVDEATEGSGKVPRLSSSSYDLQIGPNHIISLFVLSLSLR